MTLICHQEQVFNSSPDPDAEADGSQVPEETGLYIDLISDNKQHKINKYPGVGSTHL